MASDPTGAQEGNTELSVTPAKDEGNMYVYKITATAVSLPTLGQVLSASTWSAWDGEAEITVAANKYITLAEIDASRATMGAGQVLSYE